MDVILYCEVETEQQLRPDHVHLVKLKCSSHSWGPELLSGTIFFFSPELPLAILSFFIFYVHWAFVCRKMPDPMESKLETAGNRHVGAGN